jgi:hypothetical protein
MVDRGTDTAAALPPGGVWQDYTDLTEARRVSFEMYLNSAWENKPKWSTAPLVTAGAGGQFKTLVHELSHLGLNTDDHIYRAANCVNLATTNAATAFDNADNWGFFIEEFA